MPVNANNIVVGKKKEPVKAPRKLSFSISASDVVIKNEPKKVIRKQEIVVETAPANTNKYETVENGELVRKINKKSGYMKDVFNID